MIKIEPMTHMHVQEVAQIEKHCFSDAWSSLSITAELHNPLSLWLVAMDGQTLVGYIGSQTVLPESDMMNLAVLPQYRRCGIARLLVQSLIEALSEKGVDSLTLEVRVSNTAAIALYEKLGFLPVGRRPNYYHNPKEDALIMRKEWTR